MRRMLLSFALLTGAASAVAQQAPAPSLTIHLAVPASTPVNAAVYVAGTFNDWNPADPHFRLAPAGEGAYAITLPDSIRGPVEFKFTLGSWDAGEVDSLGRDLGNRTFTIPASGPATYDGTVARWRTGPAAPRVHTATASVSILDTAFVIPQLGRTRRVWLYLPPGYRTSRRRYPVLYLQDGQNVFDAATSYAGEWGVDETLDSLHALGDPGVIVVAVDNGGAERIDEYMPWKAVTGDLAGGGQGGQYVDFLAQTLKPYVDAHYRTLRDPAHTGIGGSSLGGLISCYAALKYPRVFGRAIVFSTPFFLNPQLYAMARAFRQRRPATRFYFDMGAAEGLGSQGLPDSAMVRSQRAMVDTLAAARVDTVRDVRDIIRADGQHKEWFWRREFPAAYLFLFGKTTGR
jgi:predicted alpha/beta superfamily hydrolase